VTTTATDTRTIPPLRHREAMQLAATEYGRLLDAVDRLAPDDWAKTTVNDGWGVKAMLGHVLGMMEMNAGLREMRRQVSTATKAAKESGRPGIDELTGLQVHEHAGLSTDEIVARLRRMAPRALEGRSRPPRFLRALPVVDPMVPGEPKWKLGYLLDVILTRDVWTHRGDLARAVGQELVVTSEHDGRIVADVVREWAGRHGQPFTLVLTGPAGGTYTQGTGGEHHELDAVEFCRILSGRGSGTGLLTKGVPF
jgi:uncharacterized protein (TIGR03083 family)